MTASLISLHPLRRHPSLFGLIVIYLTAFTVIALLSAQVFEHLPHSEDEAAYLFQAKVFAQNQLAVPTPPLRQAFWSPFVVDYQELRFGKYPPSWPFLLSLGVRLGAPWLVNATLAATTLALIAWLGHCFCGREYTSLSKPPTPSVKTALTLALSQRERGLLACSPLPEGLGVRAVGLWAAGLGLVTPGFLFLSSSLLSHTASLFWSTLGLVGLFYLTKKWCVVCEKNGLRTTYQCAACPWDAPRQQWIYSILTGAALGADFITRPFAGVGMGLAVSLFLLALIWRGEIKWTILFWLAVGGLTIATSLPLYWWAITGDPTFNAYLLVWPYDRLGFGPDIGPYGYTIADAVFINTRLKLTALATGLFGWPGWTNLLFLPIPFLARRANRWDWLLLGTILSLIFVHIFYWAFGGTDGGFPRYYYDALPAFLLLTVRGIQIAGEMLAHVPFLKSERTGEGQRLSQKQVGRPELTPSPTLPLRGGGRSGLRWLPVGLVILFIAYNLIWNLPPLLGAQKGKYGITAAQLEIVEQAGLPEPALVIVKNVEQWSDFAAPFAANSPTLDGPIVYASDEGPEMTHKLREQFKDRTCWELEEGNLKRCKEVDGNQ